MLGGRGHQTHADEGHPRVTLAARGTLRSGSPPVYLPPLLLLPGDKGGVAKPAVVRLGDDEAGGFRVPPTPFPRPLIQSRNLRFSPSKSLRERPEKSRPRGQGWWSGKLPPPGRDKPRTQKGPVVDTHPCAQVVRARQSRGRERRQRPRFGRRGWGQANGEIAAKQEQTATQNPLTPGPELLSTGTGRVGK